MKLLPILLIATLILAAGCVGQQQPQPKNFSIVRDGVEYVFSNTLEGIQRAGLSQENEIVSIVAFAPKVNIIYKQGTDDDSSLAIAATELSSKLAHYYAFTQKRRVEIAGIDAAQNQTGNQAANITGARIVMRGPLTGAQGTGVFVAAGTIIVEGADRTNLTAASDRLALHIIQNG